MISNIMIMNEIIKNHIKNDKIKKILSLFEDMIR